MANDVNLNEIYNRDIEEYGRFSSMLSKSVHDINNPLAVFIGQISIIELLQQRGQLDDDKMAKILDKFKTSSETLKERIGYLRNFYKVPINDAQFSKLENAVASACYYYENEAYLAGITINIEHVKDIKTTVLPNQVFMVVKHLVQNAVESLKLNNKDGGNIDVICTQMGDKVEISVKDDGPGLVCQLELATELGYTTKRDKTGGTGLAMVKKVLDEHKIELIYDGSNGARFSFVLPIQAEEEDLTE